MNDKTYWILFTVGIIFILIVLIPEAINIIKTNSLIPVTTWNGKEWITTLEHRIK